MSQFITSVTRRFEWDAGHRVLGHEGKCAHLHGHRYAAEITFIAPQLDFIGRIIDFGVLKEKIGSWIDSNLDHNLMLHNCDPILSLDADTFKCVTGGKSPYIMDSGNPTAENIAQMLYHQTRSLIGPPIDVIQVRIYETPNCFADYSAIQVSVVPTHHI